jgi:hypothetical protein
MVTEVPSGTMVDKVINPNLITGFFGLQFGQVSLEEKEQQLRNATKFYI